MGLMTPGSRVESVLLSLPTTASWEYRTDLGTDPASSEGELMEVLRGPPKEWAVRPTVMEAQRAR